jgi:hypothetical protein
VADATKGTGDGLDYRTPATVYWQGRAGGRSAGWHGEVASARLDVVASGICEEVPCGQVKEVEEAGSRV